MRVTFVSNYMNHHQQPFSEAMRARLGEDYAFIQTQPMEKERVQMGWDTSAQSLSFVRKFWEQEETCRQLILDSDVVIFGWTGMEELIVPRLQAGKLTFRNSERIYRDGQWKMISPRGLRQKYRDYTQYREAPYYLLCSGGYVASDFSLIHSFPGKMLKWGYFPPYRSYDCDFLKKKHERVENAPVELLWAGRFLELKHPEMALRAAVNLLQKKIPFHLTMIGAGELEQTLHQLTGQLRLTEHVTFTGFQKPEQVRAYMEKAQIFMATSDHREGWGAVLNEAMNSGCAVVADHLMGAAPYLIRHGSNGYVYRNDRGEECIRYVENLAKDATLCGRLGAEAYRTIAETWNAGKAADNFLADCESLLEGKKEFPVTEGPASPAPVIAPGKMYRILTEQR